MTYTEIRGNLFSAPRGCYLCHCISADFALGKGIAKTFNELYNVKANLRLWYHNKSVDYWDSLGNDYKGYILVTQNVINLVTKRNYWNKPTYKSMRNALSHLRNYCDVNGVHYIAMPRIGCGLDKLDWAKVSSMIKEIFKGSDVAIAVYY